MYIYRADGIEIGYRGIAVLEPRLYRRHRQRRPAISPYTLYTVLHWYI